MQVAFIVIAAVAVIKTGRAKLIVQLCTYIQMLSQVMPPFKVPACLIRILIAVFYGSQEERSVPDADFKMAGIRLRRYSATE